MGHATDTSGYLVYHKDENLVMSWGYVNVFPRKFPCVEQRLAGENPATLVTGDWRRWAHFSLQEVADRPLSEFLTGKQIKVVLPHSMYPEFQGRWEATCQRPITLKTSEVCM